MEDFVKGHCRKIRSLINSCGIDKLDCLKPRERKIIEMRMENKTLEEIGKEVSMPRPNVLRSQRKAIEKILARTDESNLMW